MFEILINIGTWGGAYKKNKLPIA